MHLEEISEVVAIDINETPQFDPRRRLLDPRDVVEICSSLITVTTRSSADFDFEGRNPKFSGSFVLLAHFSVKEYLTSGIIRQGQAVKYSLKALDCHMFLAKDCLAYLLHFNEPGPLSFDVFAEYPLLGYVAENWTTHAQVAEQVTNTLCQELSMPKKEAFSIGSGSVMANTPLHRI